MDVNQEQYYRNDELKIYRGEDFVVSKHIILHQPILDEICDYGEQEYYTMIYNLTATPQFLKAQLWDIGIDYTEITPYELFYKILYKMYPKEKTSIIFGDLDFSKFQILKKEKDDSIYLNQDIYMGDIYSLDNELLYHFSGLEDAARFINCTIDELLYELNTSRIYGDYVLKNIQMDSIEIDEFTYNVIVDYICKSHFIKRDFKQPANNSTKLALIEDAREEANQRKDKEYHSQLKNLISTMINSNGFKYNHEEVWHMKINAFMDSVKRISKIKSADLLLQSGYSGFGVNLKEISDKQIDWLGELD